MVGGGREVTDAGHRIYTPLFLEVYDPLVLGFYARWVWRCPVSRLTEHYKRHIGRRHLDVGPGTGYFLERTRLPAELELTLLDPQLDVLTYASRRLRHRNAGTVRADVCNPLPEGQRFDSVALNYVLHCLPGPQVAKASAVRNVAAVLAPDGVLFGATILGEPHLHTRLARAVLWYLNRNGVFDNRTDTDNGLRAMLDESFEDIDVDVVGSVAVFSATAPRRASQ